MRGELTHRSLEPELMDVETLTLEDYRAFLEDLALVNILTLTHRPILAWLDRAIRDLPTLDKLTILDVGFGYGDLLRRVHRWSALRRRTVDLIGIDLIPLSEVIARAATHAGIPIEYRTADVFRFNPGRPVDFVISSQTAHHLSQKELVAFVRWMEQIAKRGWFIADLHRHSIPFHSFRFLSRIGGLHRFVQNDGPLSIARSFRRADWDNIVAEAGLDRSDVAIRWHVPFRLCVSRLK